MVENKIEKPEDIIVRLFEQEKPDHSFISIQKGENFITIYSPEEWEVLKHRVENLLKYRLTKWST